MDEVKPGHPLRRFLTRGQIRREVDEELRFHLEMRAAELARQGWSRAEASQEALRRFGNLEETRSVCFEHDRRREHRMRRREYLDELRQDLILGVRQLRRRPAFALVAVVTLAVGIGANTAIFSAADHVLMRPLPYGNVDRVVTLWETDAKTGESRKEVSPGNFLDWAERAGSFETIGLAEPFGFDLTSVRPPQPLNTWLVTEEFLPALGVTPLIGRTFTPEEYQPNAPPVVILSHELWQRRFGSDSSIVGRTIQLDFRPAVVAGVLPPRIEYPVKGIDLWAPKVFRREERDRRTSAYMRAAARLKPGFTVEGAQADMDRVTAGLASEHPTTNASAGVNVVPLREAIVGDVRPALLMLLGAVGFVLLIACANVANLLLARGAGRQRELAVRAAMGGSRARLARQLLAEAVVLGGAGCAGGVLAAYFGVRALLALSPPELPRLETIAIDGRVLAYAIGVSLLTAVLFGAAPALRLSRPNLVTALKSGGRTARGGHDRNRLGGALVISEVALAVVLLIGAGLLGRSFLLLLGNDPGFHTEGRAQLQLFLWDLNPEPQQRIQRVQEIVERLAATPGVTGAAAVSALPFHPNQIDPHSSFTIDGRVQRPGDELRAYTTVATGGYFELMGISMLRGRDFTAADRADAPPVTIVNETFARRYFPNEDPLGERITVGVMGRPRSREIVGVVGDVRPTTLDSEPRPELFVPHAQQGTGSVTFVVRTRMPPAALIPTLQEQIWDLDPRQSVNHASTLGSLVSDTLIERRFHLLVLGTFSAIALALAAIGLYGLISFSIGQRFTEIGVRMALGAQGRDIIRMVVSQGLRLVLPGVALGVAGALALTGFLHHMLYGVTPTDPITFLQLPALMVLVAAVATYVPVRRTLAADPIRALRWE